MKKGTLYRALLVIVGILVSFVLALGAWGIYSNYGIRTPGIRFAVALASNKPEELGRLGEVLRIQFCVDFVFWFVVLCLIYFVITKVRQASKEPG